MPVARLGRRDAKSPAAMRHWQIDARMNITDVVSVTARPRPSCVDKKILV
jgi:hypothetical protein